MGRQVNAECLHRKSSVAVKLELPSYDWGGLCKYFPVSEARPVVGPLKIHLTPVFKTHFSDVQVTAVLPRVLPRNKPENVNRDFIAYCEKKGYPIPDNRWRVPELTIDASYAETAKFFVRKPVGVNHELLLKAMREVVTLLRPIAGESGTVTFREVLGGMPLQNSPGYPLNQKYASKLQAIEEHNMVEQTKNWIQSLEEERCVPEIYFNQQKFEIRKFGKAARTFMVGPMRLHVLKMMLYQAQGQAFVRNNAKSWIAIGQSDKHLGWNCLWQHLHEVKNPHFWSSDISGWDRDFPPLLFEAVRRVRVALWNSLARTEKNKRLSRVAMWNTCYGQVIMENGEVVLKEGGMPSGDAETITSNSIGHMIVLIYSILLQAPKSEWPVNPSGSALFWQNFRVKLMGDDNLASYDRVAVPWFQPAKLKVGYAHWGFTFKDISESSLLTELTFLSNGFHHDRGVVIPKPDRIKVLCQMAYGAKRNEPTITLARGYMLCQNAWSDPELFALLRGYCDDFERRYNEELRQPGVPVPLNDLKLSYPFDSFMEKLHYGSDESMGSAIMGTNPIRRTQITPVENAWWTEIYEETLWRQENLQGRAEAREEDGTPRGEKSQENDPQEQEVVRSSRRHGLEGWLRQQTRRVAALWQPNANPSAGSADTSLERASLEDALRSKAVRAKSHCIGHTALGRNSKCRFSDELSFRCEWVPDGCHFVEPGHDRWADGHRRAQLRLFQIPEGAHFGGNERLIDGYTVVGVDVLAGPGNSCVSNRYVRVNPKQRQLRVVRSQGADSVGTYCA